MASIIDIENCEPERSDKYFVDTNVWYWFSSSSPTELETRPYQIEKYPFFIEKALDNGAKIFHSSFTFLELSHIIEKEQCKRLYGNEWFAKIKEFRDDPGKRELTLREIKTSWDTIRNVSACLNFPAQENFPEKIHEHLSNASLDPYDACYYEIMNKNSIVQIISDDRDFSNIANIELFTANSRVLGR
ncbi:PIN domain-containing protein [Alcanivorax sp. NBRC 102028]|uniref:PIN domain-containing protein n=1 Tax=Alcanivorax sp. NBRC 102028 TaxID=1113897 RepID=UPI000789E689|nr:PIN domain-containing protein [Alcanivorax sp. NBRC 102028]